MLVYLCSPVGSRPPTPKSDTEFENQKFDAQAQTLLTGDAMEEVDDMKWAWGELPTSAKKAEPKPKAVDEVSSGGLLSFMRKTKKVRHQPEQEGIYLEDLNLDQMDPEVAALYLYHGGSKR
jgi:phosphatidate phosphatase LPIN